MIFAILEVIVLCFVFFKECLPSPPLFFLPLFDSYFRVNPDRQLSIHKCAQQQEDGRSLDIHPQRPNRNAAHAHNGLRSATRRNEMWEN